MADSVTLKLVCENRWWFGIARAAVILLIMARIIKDAEKAVGWLARNGMRFRVSAQ